MTRPVVARSRRASPILICQKCLRRHSKGGKIRRELKRDLKQQGDGARKAPRLVAASCFGICPKRAVVLASGKTLRNDEYVLVSSRAEVEDALGLLQGEPGNG